ncbi:TnpV protein [Coprococcus comes]|uniref:TnpV protein n=1 Tax=Coprococcus comes TaxID=410072 RepID=UPI003F8905D8
MRQRVLSEQHKAEVLQHRLYKIPSADRSIVFSAGKAAFRFEGVTEALKAENQMLWVQRMNNIRSAAMEIVSSELIYC